MQSKNYESKYEVPKSVFDTGADYVHTKAHQAAYDFSVYIHDKMKKLPHYEKFTLQKEIREAIDLVLDEIEQYEITKVASHLYMADRQKRRLLRKLRLAYDLNYSAINENVLFYCATQIATIGALIGGLIAESKERKNAQKGSE
jgi:hypothetical protein